ncbi:PP2C family serine/threonine-protein phosphatase [Maridesulfovibrio sp.]|uniref:PP2C family protein-serine/threonine phosphatase n=1 Tax=Maridesulfovibrio sp. TaxID=2795000 RepID=UPI002A18BEF6|nr:PP2C family serine/threonine-protein phosphatase [Maridesulfovibrio sp.]
MEMKVDSSGRTHTGKVRPHNEDSFLVQPDLGLFVVCDGLGGHSKGEVASETAVGIIAQRIRMGESLENAVLAAHEAVRALPVSEEEGPRPGSTVAVLQLCGEAWTVCWVGDSRVWLIGPKGIRQLTVDHTAAQQLVNWGEITPEEAATHPHRSRLTQALGLGEAPPEVGRTQGKISGDTYFLLASDGMTHWDKPQELEKVVRSSGDCDAITDRLLSDSLEQAGHDNITVVCVRAQGEPESLLDKARGVVDFIRSRV